MRQTALLLLVLALGVAGCDSSEEPTPEEVWTLFIEAVNAGDVETIESLVASQIVWTWDTNLLAIHRSSSGREEAVTGIEDLIGRGITFDSTVVEVIGATVTAETVFHEPGLADLLGGHTLLQTDVVTVSEGVIVTWASTADADRSSRRVSNPAATPIILIQGRNEHFAKCTGTNLKHPQ